MPRLGSDDEEEGIPLVGQPFGNRRREREATAYAASGHGSFHKLEALKLISVLVGFLVVRNMLSHDYRDNAREYLKVRAGKTDDEIDRYYVPRTFSERSAKALAKKSEAEQLQQTVAQLQQKVDQLQWKIFGTNETDKVKEFMSQ